MIGKWSDRTRDTGPCRMLHDGADAPHTAGGPARMKSRRKGGTSLASTFASIDSAVGWDPEHGGDHVEEIGRAHV